MHVNGIYCHARFATLVQMTINQDVITLALAAWGTITGTLALLIEYSTFKSDKARLKVDATMSYGYDHRFGKETSAFITVGLTNLGRGIIRIRKIAFQVTHPLVYRCVTAWCRWWRQPCVIQDSIGIYTGSTDPIDEMLAKPNISMYPPSVIVLEDSQHTEIKLIIGNLISEMLPKPTSVLIVEDHVGRSYRKRFHTFTTTKANKTEPYAYPVDTGAVRAR
jgi:hypothetical protein